MGIIRRIKAQTIPFTDRPVRSVLSAVAWTLLALGLLYLAIVCDAGARKISYRWVGVRW